jgi:oligoribonuclease NrnB/cAMP/cGMP phosphodiesterase (DHH superfamily)
MSASGFMSEFLVLYHAECADGMTAAWVAKQDLPYGTEFKAVTYGEAPPDVTGRKVYILDFAYPRKTLLEMKEKAKILMVLDHHETNAEDLKDLNFCEFDMTRSGARLALNHFFPVGTKSHWLVDYSEDRDLWAWKLPASKEINACIQSYPKTMEAWDKLNDLGPDVANAEGRGILRFIDSQVELICKEAREMYFKGHVVLGVPTPILQSEVGEKLAQGKPFSLTWFDRANGDRVYSLRSRGKEGINVGQLAKQFPGGGGHPRAAGFSKRLGDFER